MTLTRAEIEALLDRLDDCVAEDLEGQRIEFKEWDRASVRRSLRRVVDMAVCMANGGGGTVVFGVADEEAGRRRAIVGVPYDVDLGGVGAAVRDSTDPGLTPEFEDLAVPEGTGRLVLMHVHAGTPPYTDTAGRGTIRVGGDCKPLTGTMRARLRGRGEENSATDGSVREETADPAPSPMTARKRATARAAVMRALKLRAGDSELLTNSEVRRLTGLDRNQAWRLMRDLRAEFPGIVLAGRGRAAGYSWVDGR